MLDQNPPERMFEMYIKKSSQDDFALKSKLWHANSLLHCSSFAGNSRSTGISQLRASKTRSKRTCSHFSLKKRLFPYVHRPFHLLWPITIYLCVFELEAEENFFIFIFHEVLLPLPKKIVGMLRTRF